MHIRPQQRPPVLDTLGFLLSLTWPVAAAFAVACLVSVAIVAFTPV
jgi:hypothetical protein